MIHTLVKDNSPLFHRDICNLLVQMGAIDRAFTYDPKYPCIGWDDEAEEFVDVDIFAEDDDGEEYKDYHSIADFLKVVEDDMGLNEIEVTTEDGYTATFYHGKDYVDVGGSTLTKNDIEKLHKLFFP